MARRAARRESACAPGARAGRRARRRQPAAGRALLLRPWRLLPELAELRIALLQRLLELRRREVAQRRVVLVRLALEVGIGDDLRDRPDEALARLRRNPFRRGERAQRRQLDRNALLARAGELGRKRAA